MTTQREGLTRPNDRLDLIVQREYGGWTDDRARLIIYENPRLAASIVLPHSIEYTAPKETAE